MPFGGFALSVSCCENCAAMVGEAKLTILSVGGDRMRLLRRNDALALGGFRVISPRTPRETPLLALEQQADAVVIGASIPSDERGRLIPRIRVTNPNLPIFFANPGGDQREPLADVEVDTSKGENVLAEALRKYFRI